MAGLAESGWRHHRRSLDQNARTRLIRNGFCQLRVSSATVGIRVKFALRAAPGVPSCYM